LRAGAALEARPAGGCEPVEQLLLAAQDSSHQGEIAGDLGFAEPGRGAREVGLDRLEIGPRFANHLERSPVASGDDLGEIRDDQVAAADGFARVRLLEPRYDPEERRLTRPVWADDPDAGAGRELEVDAVEDPARAE